MYQVFARKWRPRNFDELVGQKHVSRTLGNAIESGRVAHAYIFAGLRGTGKTTVARIFAKCLNCEEGPTISPCGKCDPCREIAESSALDVMELDAASRTSVDNIRELQEVISYSPVRDRYRVLIIDEAHMLSKAAFNALLKTLEEPPPRVIFVLATTELQKLLPTILSRCQVFEFRRVAVREVADLLKKICEAEKIKISDASLERIARAGEGSVRDSLSVLEQVCAFSGSEVDDQAVLGALGAVKASVLTGMMESLARRDAGAMLGVLDGLLDDGHDLVHFWNELVGAMRDVLFLRSAPDREDLLSRSPDEATELSAAAEPLSNEDLVRAFQLLADLEFSLKTSSQPRFMFEAALIRLAGLGAVRPIEEVLRNLGGETVSKARPVQKKNPVEPSAAASPSLAEEGGSLSSRIVAATLQSKPMVGAILQQAESIEIAGELLSIRFEAGTETLVRRLEQPANLELIKKVAQELAGRTVDLRVETQSGTATASRDRPPALDDPTPAKRGPDVAAKARPAAPAPKTGKPATAGRAPRPARASEGAGPTAAAGAPVIDEAPPIGEALDGGATPAGGGDKAKLMDRAQKEPGVRKLLREFGAQIVDIKPL